jgi:hypothetical protein
LYRSGEHNHLIDGTDGDRSQWEQTANKDSSRSPSLTDGAGMLCFLLVSAYFH